MSISLKSILLNRKTLMVLLSALGLVFISLLGWIFQLKTDTDKISGGSLIVSLMSLVTVTGFSAHSIAIEKLKISKDPYIKKLEEKIGEIDKDLEDSNIELIHKRLQIALIAIKELSEEQVMQLLSDDLQNRANFFIANAKEYENHLEDCHKISDWLDSDYMQDRQLWLIAAKACDWVIANPSNLDWINSINLNEREKFIEEIYELLAAWLSMSIRFDMPLPLPSKILLKGEGLAFADRVIYREAISYIGNQGINYFWRENEEVTEITQKIISDYLNHLLKLIDPTASIETKLHS